MPLIINQIIRKRRKMAESDQEKRERHNTYVDRYIAKKKKALGVEEYRRRVALKSREWRAAHPNYGKEKRAAVYAANREELCAKHRAWRSENPGWEKAYKATPEYKARRLELYRINKDDPEKKKRLRLRQKKFHARHKKERLAAMREYRIKHATEIKAQRAEFYRQNAERITRAHREIHGPKYRRNMSPAAKDRRRKAGRLANYARYARTKGKLSKGIADKLMKLQRGRCAVCRRDVSKGKYHLDHVMPMALGGVNEDFNMQILCPPCNQRKSAKHPVDFMQSRGLLI